MEKQAWSKGIWVIEENTGCILHSSHPTAVHMKPIARTQRESREGWPPPTYGVQIQGVLPWLVRLARCAGTKDFYPVLAALISPVHDIIFLTVHYLRFLCTGDPHSVPYTLLLIS